MIWKYIREDIYNLFLEREYKTERRVAITHNYLRKLQFYISQLRFLFSKNNCNIMKADLLFCNFPRKIKINGRYSCSFRAYRIHLGKKRRNNYQIICNIRQAAANVNRTVEIYLDIPSDRLRIDYVYDLHDEFIYLKKGDIFQIVWEERLENKKHKYTKIGIYNLHKYEKHIKINDRLWLKDGSYEGVVIKKELNSIWIRCSTDVKISEMINCLWPDSNLNYMIIDDVAIDFLHRLKETEFIPDYFILSFVRDEKNVAECRNFLEKYFDDNIIKIVTKIETKEATNNLEKILKVSDKIMIGRGDLAPQIGYNALPLWQKKL